MMLSVSCQLNLSSVYYCSFKHRNTVWIGYRSFTEVTSSLWKKVSMFQLCCLITCRFNIAKYSDDNDSELDDNDNNDATNATRHIWQICCFCAVRTWNASLQKINRAHVVNGSLTLAVVGVTQQVWSKF